MQLSKITYNFLEQADFLKLLCSTFLAAFSSLLKKGRKYLLDKVSYDSGVNINPSLYLFDPITQGVSEIQYVKVESLNLRNNSWTINFDLSFFRYPLR